ncbi:DUF6214 family protein [Streptomyces sp. NPDC001093]|uniref:DUF6214 family protein n=1 Tax=Streptomyces sp. NPDC001093 TaxID=3154376 RepID=UPI00331719EC
MWPAWEVREHCDTTSWFHVRLAFPDGARVDALAVVREGCVSIEDVSAQPALSLPDLTVLAGWIEGPLFESCGVERPYETDGDEHLAERHEPEAGEGAGDEESGEEKAGEEEVCAEKTGEEKAGDDKAGGEGSEVGDKVSAEVTAPCAGPRRARPVWPRGIEGRRRVAQEYRAAQQQGCDPVLAVMSATGYSRRRSLRLIAQARDAGFLPPRHARRT